MGEPLPVMVERPGAAATKPAAGRPRYVAVGAGAGAGRDRHRPSGSAAIPANADATRALLCSGLSRRKTAGMRSSAR